MTSVVDDLYDNLVGGIAAGRKKTPDEVRAIIDQGPFTAPQALKAGLVDELRFEDQMWGELKDRLKTASLHVSRWTSTQRSPRNPWDCRARAASRWWWAQGDIVRGSPGDDGAGETNLTSNGFNKLLRRVENDSHGEGRGGAHRFARRRGHGLRRNLARR